MKPAKLYALEGQNLWYMDLFVRLLLGKQQTAMNRKNTDPRTNENAKCKGRFRDAAQWLEHLQRRGKLCRNRDLQVRR